MILVFCMMAFLLGPTALYVGQRWLHLDLPSWFTAESARYLSGEGGEQSQLDIAENLSLDHFFENKLQASIEYEVESYIPLKATVLLLNAEMQRQAIRLSNEVFCFDCYPTFFGSTISYLPNLNAVVQNPYESASRVEERVRNFGSQFAGVAERFPEKRFAIVVADSATTSAQNSVLSELSSSITTSHVANLLRDELSDSANVIVTDVVYESGMEYYKNYYTTDHHWNGWGAADAYLTAVDELSRIGLPEEDVDALKTPLDDLEPLRGLEWVSENGSNSRTGLMELNESVFEPALPLYNILTNTEGSSLVAVKDGVARMTEYAAEAEYNFYETWYGQYKDDLVINAKAPLQESSALVICDSYGDAFKWMVTTGFGETRTVFDLMGRHQNTLPLAETLENDDSEIVFLVSYAYNFFDRLDRTPSYLH